MSYSRIVLLFWICLGGVLGTLGAAELQSPTQVWAGQAVVRFAGTSTLHDFGGQLAAQPFSLTLSNDTWSASAEVLASGMETANTKRDRKMHQMLEVSEFPEIHGSVTHAPVPGSSGTNVTLRMTIRETTHDLPVRITAWTQTADEIRFHADWTLSLKAYALKPPSVLGVIRVGEQVNLEADVTATRSAGVPASSAPSS
jgi:polyisoprenoid-binding protein YceI